MNAILEFNPQRFWHLIKLDAVTGHRRFWIVAGALFGLVLSMLLYQAYEGDVKDIKDAQFILFPNLILIGGFLYTSYSFGILDNAQTRMNYLNLPASNLEKFLSKWFFTVIAFPIVAIAGYGIFNLILNGLASSVFGLELSSFEPFRGNNILSLKLYVVLSSIFLLGAIIFRKYAAFKTVFSIFLMGLGFALITALIVRIVFWDVFSDWNFQQGPPIEGQPSEGFEEFVTGVLWPSVQTLFWVILPIIVWTVAFFKLKEKEV